MIDGTSQSRFQTPLYLLFDPSTGSGQAGSGYRQHSISHFIGCSFFARRAKKEQQKEGKVPLCMTTSEQRVRMKEVMPSASETTLVHGLE